MTEEAATKQAASIRRKRARLAKEEIQRERGAFLLSAATARDFAFYDGVVDAKVINTCRLTIDVWTKLLTEFENSERRNNQAKAAA